MKRLWMVFVATLPFITGCYVMPVSETYATDCVDCSYPVPRTRYYTGYYDYWTPFAFIGGAALGYALGDNHHYHHSYPRHGYAYGHSYGHHGGWNRWRGR